MTFTEAMSHVEPLTRRCLLCEKPVRWRGCFLPREPRLWGGPPVRPGTIRGMFYGLCRRCYRRPDKAEAVEDKILTLGMTGKETWH
jgi:hypothetical protein